MNREKKDIKKCDRCEGFFIVPGYERFSVNRQGFVFDRDLRRPARIKHTISESKKIYLYVERKYPSVHRLVALTFLDDSHILDTEKKVVNHLNGDTVNNSVENLEWTTYQGNSIHAYTTGLRNDNVPVLCKDLRNNEIKRFYSYQECGRYFNVNGASIFYYLRSKRVGKLFRKYYILIKEGESWPDIDSSSLDKYQKGYGKEVFLIDKDTNKKYIFDSITSLSKFVSIRNEYLRHKLSKIELKLSNEDYYEKDNWKMTLLNLVTEEEQKEAKDMRSDAEYSTKFNMTPTLRKPKRVEVLDLVTKEKQVWNSLEEFGISISVIKNSIQKHILRKSGFYRKRYFIKYLD